MNTVGYAMRVKVRPKKASVVIERSLAGRSDHRYAISLSGSTLWRERCAVVLAQLSHHLRCDRCHRHVGRALQEVGTLVWVGVDAEEATRGATMPDEVGFKGEVVRLGAGIWVDHALPAVHGLRPDQKLPYTMRTAVLNQAGDDRLHIAPAPLVHAICLVSRSLTAGRADDVGLAR